MGKQFITLVEFTNGDRFFSVWITKESAEAECKAFLKCKETIAQCVVVEVTEFGILNSFF